MQSQTVFPWPIKIISASLLLAVWGCASHAYPTVNDDLAKNNQATFQKDAIECAQSYPADGGSGAYIPQRIACMNTKGWH